VKRKCLFKSSDVIRAVNAVKKTGAEVARVMIDTEGNIVVIVGKPMMMTEDAGNDLDKWMTKHAH
jgi:hypothetical protein